MPATTEPPTWEIRPTSDGHFQWAAAESVVQQELPFETLACGEENHSGHCLPSMADLLTLAHAKILEGDNGGSGEDEGSLMFRTGTGRSVMVSESSIRKARSVVGGVDTTGTGDETHSSVGIKGDCVPLFRTGSGRSLTIRESSIHTAAAILEGKVMNDGSKEHSDAGTKYNGFPLFSIGSGKSVTIRKSSIRKAAAILEGKEMKSGNKEHSDVGTKDNRFPLHCTGSGRSVPIRESLIKKAAAILEGKDMHTNVGAKDNGFPLFCTGSGKSVTVREYSIMKAAAILEGKDMNNGNELNEAHSDVNTKDNGFPLFSTGSGKSVSIRESSIRKAAAILEGKEVNNAYPGFGAKDNGFPLLCIGPEKSVTIRESSIRKAAAILEGKDMNNGNKSHSDVDTKDNGFPLFFTGSGKSATVKEYSIRKAAAILEGEGMSNRNETHSDVSSKGNGFPLFSTGYGKLVTMRESSIRKAAAILDRNTMSNATDFLGLAKDEKFSTIRCFEQSRTQISTKISNGESLHGNFGRDINGDTASMCITGPSNVRSVQRSPSNCLKDFCSTGSHVNNGQLQKSLIHTDYAEPPVKFHTAGGQYTSFSNDASTNARSLLEDKDTGFIEDKVMLDQYCLKRNSNHDEIFWNKENISSRSPYYEGTSKHFCRNLPSPSKRNEPSSLICKNKSEGYRLDQGNATNFPLGNTSSSKKLHFNQKPECRIEDVMPLRGSRVDILNNIAAEHPDVNPLPSEKRRSGRMSFFSPFKKPRSSRFTAPLKDPSFLATGSSKLSTTQSSYCSKISTRYPFQIKRKNIKDFFGCHPSHQYMSWSLPPEVNNMDADNALTYKFHDASVHEEIGVPVLQDMLLQAGASSSQATKALWYKQTLRAGFIGMDVAMPQQLSKILSKRLLDLLNTKNRLVDARWIANHYRWIVWKLACYDRCYPTQIKSKFLTVSNVLEELKYRYDREVNHSHRSAIKRILDGDASPASMMVLCVSAIRYTQPEVSKMDYMSCPEEDANIVNNSSLTMVKGICGTRIELTDGWYSLDALPDMWLSKQLVAGKLFVGQKLRICGAGLCGWVGPVSSLEASKTVHLQIHINGTYRAHWDDKLGFCMSRNSPLAFRCIKVAGGKVPRTLVGITRIYPVLYKERFPDGGYIIRSEKLEKRTLQKYTQRRYNIAEAIMSEQLDVVADINDSDEGAKLYKILETAAEPEVLMADMTSEQLCSFSAYQAKQKEISQIDMQKKIEKALKDAELGSRDVIPFMRVRVVGLTSKNSCRKGRFREGMITIWNPTEGQRVDLAEGKIYDVAGLVPMNCGMDVLHLQGGGSSIMWKSLPSKEAEKYEPFFSPRKSVTLSNLGVIPLASEFDIAAIVLHVEDVCFSGRQKKQWLFVSDGCNCSSALQTQELHDCLLAVSFSSSFIDNDSSSLFSHHHEGTVVGFFNLVKRARDQTNHLWVAEATENSTYSACHNLTRHCHLKVEATSAEKWAKVSYSTIQKLKERILYILGHHET